MAFLVAQMIRNLPATQEAKVPSLGREDPRKMEGPPTSVF